MKASELRIGNYVATTSIALEINDHIYQIDSGAAIQVGQNFPNFYHPIPLTSEWLIRCNMAKGDAFWINFSQDEDGHYFWVSAQNGTRYFVRIPYVHTLQNLYFALTGEELTMKEQKTENA